MAAIKKILVPTDFSEASRDAVKYACALAEEVKASVCILHVTQNPYVAVGYLDFATPPPEYFIKVEDSAREALNGLLTEEEKLKRRAEFAHRVGPAAETIVDFVREQGDIDLIVMATHGRGGVARLTMGSVADKVVRSAPCPVLTLRDPVVTRKTRAA